MAAASTGAVCSDSTSGSREDIKTQFTTREGMYKLITLSDCLRPSRVIQNGPSNTPVKLSFLNLGDGEGRGDRVCFNIGKELYYYQYAGIVKVLDLTRPLDKRVYRGTLPTCHDFNVVTASPERVMLVIGFSAGQIQLIDPISKELSRLYNEEALLQGLKNFDTYRVRILIGENTGNYIVLTKLIKIMLDDFRCICAVWCICTFDTVPLNRPMGYQLQPANKRLVYFDMIGFELRMPSSLTSCWNTLKATDKTKVTCIRWVPGSIRHFVASYASGQLHVYDIELSCNTTSSSSASTMQHYQVTARGDSYMVHAYRAKTLYNPIQRWTIGTGSINEFSFSPCGSYIATVSADGYLRVFSYAASDIVGSMRSYFGGLLCVAWSPDGRYIATGGEDDLVTLWSFSEQRVVCRGRGHRSWVGGVAFDPFASFNSFDFVDFCGSDDDFSPSSDLPDARNNSRLVDGSPDSERSLVNQMSYRLGTIGHDAMLCLWDITDEVLRRPISRTRTNTIVSRSDAEVVSGRNGGACSVDSSTGNDSKLPTVTTTTTTTTTSSIVISPSNSVVHKFATFALGDRPAKSKQRRSASATGTDQRWHFSLTSRNSDSKIQLLKTSTVMATGGVGRGCADDALRLLGTPACPRLMDSPMLVPLVGKRIAHERLTALVFREDCVVTACQEGVIYTWARPGKSVVNQQSPSSRTKVNLSNTNL